MNYAPIDGLRLLAVETGVLAALTVLAFLFFRLLRPSMSQPRWLKAILAGNLPVRRSAITAIAR